MRKPKEAPSENNSDEVVIPVKTEAKKPVKRKVTVKTKRIYLDIQLNKMMYFGETFEVDRKRAEHLANLGLVDIVE